MITFDGFLPIRAALYHESLSEVNQKAVKK